VNELKKVVVSGEGDVTRYALFWRPCGYAMIFVDHVYGVLSIYSDIGSWSHAWPNGKSCWGTETFEDFLCDLSSVEYLVNKLMTREERHEFDDERTRKEMLSELERARTEGEVSESDVGMFKEAIDGFCEAGSYSGILAAVTSEAGETLGELLPYLGEEWVWWKKSVAAVELRERILEPFIKELMARKEA